MEVTTPSADKGHVVESFGKSAPRVKIILLKYLLILFVPFTAYATILFIFDTDTVFMEDLKCLNMNKSNHQIST